MSDLTKYCLQALPVGDTFTILLYRQLGVDDLGELVGMMNAKGSYQGVVNPPDALKVIMVWLMLVVEARARP